MERPEVLQVAQMMLRELNNNDQKGDWKNWIKTAKPHQLYKELEKGVRKTIKEMESDECRKEELKSLIADCFNQIMFIAYYYKIITDEPQPGYIHVIKDSRDHYLVRAGEFTAVMTEKLEKARQIPSREYAKGYAACMEEIYGKEFKIYKI